MRSVRDGFTLIELMIVVAIIAIIAAIAIPGIMAARRSSNESAALGNIKSFATAMSTYIQKNPQQYYPIDSDSFGDYYSHIQNKGGYIYVYSCDANESMPMASSAIEEGSTTKVTKYIYVAYPSSLSTGRKIFYVCESYQIYEASLEPYPSYNSDFSFEFDFSAPPESRISVPPIEWVKLGAPMTGTEGGAE